MPANGKLVLGIALGYFVLPIVIREFWGIVGNLKGNG